jgi:hypothetical protein
MLDAPHAEPQASRNNRQTPTQPGYSMIQEYGKIISPNQSVAEISGQLARSRR